VVRVEAAGSSGLRLGGEGAPLVRCGALLQRFGGALQLRKVAVYFYK